MTDREQAARHAFLEKCTLLAVGCGRTTLNAARAAEAAWQRIHPKPDNSADVKQYDDIVTQGRPEEWADGEELRFCKLRYDRMEALAAKLLDKEEPK